MKLQLFFFNLKKKKSNISVLVFKVYKKFTLICHLYVHVCYVVVYQVGEGAHITFCHEIRQQKHKRKGIQMNLSDARRLRLCI